MKIDLQNFNQLIIIAILFLTAFAIVELSDNVDHTWEMTRNELNTNAKSMLNINSAIVAMQRDLDRIIVLTNNSMIANDTIAGLYSSRAKLFWVKTDYNASAILLNAHHEFAHYIYDKMLSSQARSGWVNISNASTEFVSNYSRTNPGEDFAESFAHGLKCEWTDINISTKDTYIRLVVLPKLEEERVLR